MWSSKGLWRRGGDARGGETWYPPGSMGPPGIVPPHSIWLGLVGLRGKGPPRCPGEPCGTGGPGGGVWGKPRGGLNARGEASGGRGGAVLAGGVRESAAVSCGCAEDGIFARTSSGCSSVMPRDIRALVFAGPGAIL